MIPAFRIKAVPVQGSASAGLCQSSRQLVSRRSGGQSNPRKAGLCEQIAFTFGECFSINLQGLHHDLLLVFELSDLCGSDLLTSLAVSPRSPATHLGLMPLPPGLQARGEISEGPYESDTSLRMSRNGSSPHKLTWKLLGWNFPAKICCRFFLRRNHRSSAPTPATQDRIRLPSLEPMFLDFCCLLHAQAF